MKNNTWRVFLAIPLSFKEREALRLSLVLSGIQLPERTIDPLNWHITVFFIGEIKDSKVANLVDILSTKKWPGKFELVLDHLGAFPDAVSAKILWCGISEGHAALRELVEEISQPLYIEGFPIDPRFYSGHLTLSRLVTTQDLTAFLNTPIRPVRLRAERFVLFRSWPGPGLHYYEELASFKLAGRG